MSLPKLRAWTLVAALGALQMPAMALADGHHARLDRQVDALERQGVPSGQKIRLIVQSNSPSVLEGLQTRGASIRRTYSRLGRIAVEISGSDLQWLASLDGV